MRNAPLHTKANGYRPLPVVAALLLALILCLSAGAAQALDKVSLRLIWVHQGQFAGVYLAQDLGYYKEAGLEVDARPGGPGLDPLGDLVEGNVDFALGWLSGGLQLRAQGHHLVHLAQLVQRSALLLVSFKDLGIKRVKELADHRLGVWGGHFDLAPNALFNREGIKVRRVPQNASMEPLLMGAVDAALAMVYNEYHQLYQAGVDFDDIHVFGFSDLGLNFPEDGIYTSEALWQRDPGLCRRFTQATLRGWGAVLDNPQAALEAVMRRVTEARLASNASHQEWMLRRMAELITYRVGREGVGRLNMEDYELMTKVLLDQGLLGARVDPQFFVMSAWSSQP